jgi:CRP-like cAMP-binding protein
MPENMDFERREGSGRSVEGDNPIRRNLLLALTPADEMERIQPHLSQVNFAFRDSIYKDGETNEHAYFPHAGVFSMVSSPEEDGMLVEVATVGREGMVGLPLLLGGGRSPGECFCQVPGQAGRIPSRAFSQLLDTCPGFRRVLLRYTQALITQISQNAACNRMHPVEERCARWLLMSQDRVGADHFELTQEFLAQMLGVRRPTVSVAAGMLQKAGLIAYSRGLIVITDRQGLEAASCNCYRIIRDEFQRLIG